jgi:hypothetical protein
MKYDIHVVDAYKFRNKFVHIYKKRVFLYTCKRSKSLQWIYWEEIIMNIRSCFLTDLNTPVQVRVCVGWATMLLCSCRKSFATTFYIQCVGDGTRLLMKLLTKYVTVRVLYSVQNVSNLEIGHFFFYSSNTAQPCL